MRISEIFNSLQGEGLYSGYPVLFLRLSGCDEKCSYCDTKYHAEGKEYKIEEIIKIINKNSANYVVWTGGEPLLQKKEIFEVISKTQNKHHQLETNGNLLENLDVFYFSYINISPKNIDIAKKWKRFDYKLDIKVVTDMKKIGTNMISYATILMPLTTYDIKKDLEIKQKVWEYCNKHNLRYSPRLHIDLWGATRGK